MYNKVYKEGEDQMSLCIDNADHKFYQSNKAHKALAANWAEYTAPIQEEAEEYWLGKQYVYQLYDIWI